MFVTVKLLFLFYFFCEVSCFLHELFPPSSSFHGIYKTSITTNSLWTNTSSNKRYEKTANVVCQITASRYPGTPSMIKVDFNQCDCNDQMNCIGSDQSKEFRSVYVQLSEGELVDRIYIHRTVLSTFVKNLYKGFISLLQVSSIQSEHSGYIMDSSGECRYKIIGNQENCFIIRKIQCEQLHHTHERPSMNEVLDVINKHNSSYKICMDDQSKWEDISALETRIVYPTLQPDLAEIIKAKQHLNIIRWDDFDGRLDEMFLMKHFGETSLVTYTERELEVNEEVFRSILDSVKVYLRTEYTATLSQVKTFYYLLDYIRIIRSEKILTDILKDDEYMDIQNQLFDLYIACGTLSCVHAVFHRLDVSDIEHTDMQERVLISLSHLTPVSKEIVALYFEKIKLVKQDDKTEAVYKQALVTLGAMLNNYLTTVNSAKYDPLTMSIEQFLRKSFETCSTDDCKLAIIAALESSQTVDSFLWLMNLMESSVTETKKGKKIGLSIAMQTGVMKALKSIPFPSNAKDQRIVETFIQNILFRLHPSLDLSIVSATVDLAMRLDNNEGLMKNIFLLFQQSPRLQSIVKMKLDRLRLWCHRQLLSSTICSNILSNFNYLQLISNVTKSPSQTLAGNYMNTRDILSEFTLEMVGLNNGLQKSSVMDISFIGTGGEVRLFSLYLYFSGIESLVGSDEKTPDPSESDEVITAGLFLNILNKPIRPIRFFEGQSGLMSAVWNAPSSLTPLLQSNLRLHDFQTSLHLQNGFVIDYKCLGVLSLDLSGSISVNLWSQTADALIRTSGAIFLESSISFFNSFSPLSTSISVSGETHVDFTTNINLNKKPIHICMKMEVPDIKVQKNLHFNRPLERLKVVQEKGLNVNPPAKSIKSSTFYPGVTYFLGNQNSEYCKVMNEE